MTKSTKLSILGMAIVCALVLPAADAVAAVMPVGPFSGSTLIDFAGLADHTEVNGLTVSGVSLAYSLGNGQVIIDGGPGITNHINPPDIVSTGDGSGILTMVLPSPATMFGYGYAIENLNAVANATTISVFSGANLLGSLSYDAVRDPNFAGGFAGIESTTAFDRVNVTFNSAAAPSFALDNITIGNVPEPATFALLALGLVVFLGLARRRLSRV